MLVSASKHAPRLRVAAGGSPERRAGSIATFRRVTAYEELAASDAVMASLVERFGELSIDARRRRRPPVDAYGMLLRSVVGQQPSVKAAATIYGRVLDLFGGRTPPPVDLLEVEPEKLREAGLSGRKVEYVRDLASHVLSGELELDRLESLSDDE